MECNDRYNHSNALERKLEIRTHRQKNHASMWKTSEEHERHLRFLQNSIKSENIRENRVKHGKSVKEN